ncbi:MAG TPA: hypothetical protein GX742_00770 [Acholeplasmataceae bacterium]|nr:hypothetical protein [Acholeplasmataceae bacterium]
MRIDETTYHEYANWKLENSDLLKELSQNASSIYFRFKHILEVVKHYYNKLIDDVNYSEEDDAIFKTGYYYLADQIEDIKTILNKVYNNDAKVLESHAKEINLFLNTIDFQTELLNNELEEDDDIQRLMDFDQDVYNFIIEKNPIPEKYYDELDDLTFKIFKKLDISYYSVNDIFLEIADELNIL